MKSFGLIAMVVIASWFVSCDSVNAQAPAPAGGGAPAATSEAQPVPTPPPPAPDVPPVPKAPEDPSLFNDPVYKNAHRAAGEPETSPSFPALREFIEDSQNAHDKLIVDRFLIGVAVLFAIIAAALLFSLPPKPREQKE